MIIKRIPTIDFNKCHPERCDHGICIAGGACPHKAFFQEEPYDFPMHIACMCAGLWLLYISMPFKSDTNDLKLTIATRVRYVTANKLNSLGRNRQHAEDKC